ncbi:MAG TPA: hypothetical protein VHS06_11650, partial [Chloroflexota bacterium]|nr:hypothetical protein [Chloroflexota bacterium]
MERGDHPDSSQPYAKVGGKEVPETKALFQLPSMQNRLGAKLGDKVVLAGFDLQKTKARPGDTVRLT